VVRDGRIEQVMDASAAAPSDVDSVEDLGDAALMPGVVDVHVHLNEPGRTLWEGFETGTDAAAAGGVTSLVEMPLNSIPATTSLSAFEQKRAAMAGKCRVDVGLWGGVVPGHSAELRPLYEAGVLGFKCFLVPSGVDEFEHVSEADLHEALPILAALDAPLLVHCEVPAPIETASTDAWPSQTSLREYASFLASRPRTAENQAVAQVIRLARQYGARVHIVHLSSSDVVDMLREARTAGLKVTAETCPHYLTFASENIADGATHFKCCPPIREAANRDALWAGLSGGDIDFVASDHSPCPPELKGLESGDFRGAWGGIASVQFALAATWTGARARGHGLDAIARWMSAEPARFAGLGDRKGRIASGCDADLVVFEPESDVLIAPEDIRHRHALSPYAGRPLMGRVRSTWLRGEKIYESGELLAERSGVWLNRIGGAAESHSGASS
jgi:allantoinase